MNAPLNEEIEGKKNVPINTGQHKMFTIENELNADIGKSLLGNNFDFYFAFMAVYIFNWIGYLLVITIWCSIRTWIINIKVDVFDSIFNRLDIKRLQLVLLAFNNFRINRLHIFM
jgi:hypothetical protein